MSREILFRAKRKDNGEWVEGYYERKYDVFGGFRHLIFWTKDYLNWEYFEVQPETVVQFTGLYDDYKWEQISENEKEKFLSEWNCEKGRKNTKEDWRGRKIFEWDIVKRTDFHDAKEPSIGFIEYDNENTSFLIHWMDAEKYSATFPWKDRIAVCGNVFDNTELLGCDGGWRSV